ncbi:MAG TPA: DNA-directed DNA polymerase II small subunit [Candidatus Nanoarchaeia archaeon]|nr:DNA-directed DNA polymerase II small subunit [Candidatus Nanoarchaeia archaeon]
MEQEILTKKKEIIHFLIEKNVLVEEKFLEKLDDTSKLNSIYFQIKNQRIHPENLSEIFDIKIEDENKNKDELREEDVKVLFSYEEKDFKKREVGNFVSYFNSRYKSIERMLRQRQELEGVTTISRVIGKKDRDSVSVIGMVSGKRISKTGSILLTVEDITGEITVIINKNRQDLAEIAKSIVYDEIIGVMGTNGGGVIFANNIIFPGVPSNKELKKSNEESYAVFLSDLHIGSSKFLTDEFSRFLQWIRGETENENHRSIAKKVKYVFVVGDLVDGVGIYPRQESELEIKDIYDQYSECARLLEKIPSHIKLIMCPGNHDAVRISEPQPAFMREFSEPIFNLKNALLVSNPSAVTIGIKNEFPGFDVLMYHGYSFDYYVANVDSIRSQGGYDRADLIMKFLLQKRHLAPAHTSTLYIPDSAYDPLVIEKIPDFFATGHIHKSSVSNYKNITLLSGSCFQAKTAFQEKVGHHPEPSRVPVINLQTREIRILKFGKD